VAAENKLDFVIAAHIQGMEQLSGLINRVSALEKETQRLKTANTGLAASTDAVVKNGTRYNNMLDAQSKALRQHRQGTQQLGMQVNDFFTSVSTGASPMQAFAQQLGQAGYAMSMMGGVTGRVGAFLAGPWGAAVLIATMLIGPLTAGLMEMSKATDKVGESTQKTSGYLGELNERYKGDLDEFVSSLNLTSEEMQKLGDLTITLSDLVVAFFQVAGREIVNLSEVVAEKLGFSFEQFQKDTRDSISSTMRATVREVASIYAAFAAAYKAIVILWENLPDALGNAVYATANAVIGAVEGMINRSIAALNDFLAQTNPILRMAQMAGFNVIGTVSLDRLANPYAEANRKAGEKVGEAFGAGYEESFTRAMGWMGKFWQNVEDRAAENAKSGYRDAAKKAGFLDPDKAGAGRGSRAAGKKSDPYENIRKLVAYELKKDKWIAQERLKSAKWLDGELTKIENNSDARRNDNLEIMQAKLQDMTKQTLGMIDSQRAEMEKSFESIGNTVSDAFKGMLTGAMSWKDGMRGIINAVIDELWRLYVVQQIVGMVTKFLGGAFGHGSAMAGVSAGAKSLAGMFPGNANGTPSWRGGMTWVGERGPELINVPRGASIIPAHRAQNMAGGGMTINVDARGSADPAAVRRQVEQGILEAAPAIIAAAEARTVAGLRRPKLGGVMQ
jgi:hypothetical protein